MKKVVLFLTGLMLFAGMVSAKPIDASMARRVAETWMRARGMRNVEALVDVTAQTPFTEFYVFVAQMGGFILVSGDDCTVPVLGYSLTAPFDTEFIPEHVHAWLDGYEKEIGRLARAQRTEVDGQWKLLLAGEMPPAELETEVAPLLTTTWGQRPYYNQYCPYDSASNTIAPAGCVPVATSQVMKFWRCPDTGYSSHTYTSQRTYSGITYTYPDLTADFGATAYQWNMMPDALTGSSSAAKVDAVATLLYHVGVAVETKYCPSAASANNYNTRGKITRSSQTALMKFFKYRSDMYPIMRADYSDADYCALLRAELDQIRPILFRGSHTSGGHSFVLDGYNDDGYFHVNWGWRGSYEGYFVMGALNPYGGGDGSNDSGTYNMDNVALMGIRPHTDWGTATTTVTTAVTGSGSVTGGGSYAFGDTVTLLATADEGYRFGGWSDGSKFNPRQIIANGGSYTFTATFEAVAGSILHYCPGDYEITGYGYSSGGANRWGIHLPAALLNNVDSLKAVQFYVLEAGDYGVTIYTGENHSAIAYTDTVSFTEDDLDQWQTIVLDSSVLATDDLWIIFYYNGVGYPQTCTYYSGVSGAYISGNNFNDLGPERQLSAMVKGIFSSSHYNVTVNRVCRNCSEEIPAGYITGEGTYADGDTVTLEGYVQGCDLSLDYWLTEEGDTIFDNPYSFVIHSDRTITAVFGAYGGIDEVNPQSISLYPNPAGGKVNIVVNEGLGIRNEELVSVVDVTGRTVLTQAIRLSGNQTITLDVSTLAEGTYFVRIVGSEGTAMRKLIVKH